MAKIGNQRTCRSEAVFNVGRRWLSTANFGAGVAPALPRAELWPAFRVPGPSGCAGNSPDPWPTSDGLAERAKPVRRADSATPISHTDFETILCE